MDGMLGGFIEGQGAQDAHALNQQTIQKQQQELDAQKKMSALMAQSKDENPGPNPSNYVTKIGQLAMQAGNFSQGTELMTKASSMRHNEALAAQELAKTRGQEIREVEGILSGVTDEASWNKGNAIFTMMTGKPSPLEGVPYSPENVKLVQDALANEKDVMQAKVNQARVPLLEAQTKTAKAKEAYDIERTITEKEARAITIKAKASAISARDSRTAKTGISAKAPPAAQLRIATDMIVRDYQDISPEEARIVGRDIAERASDITAQHPGMRITEAMAQAYGEKQKEGAFDDYVLNPMRPHKTKLPALPEGFIMDGSK